MEIVLICIGQICIWLPFASLIVAIVAKLKGKDRIAHIAECIFLWMTLSLVLPFRAKKHDLLGKGLYRWIVTFLSPAAIATYIMIYVAATINKPLPYDELDFTSRNDIAAITGVPDFPEFEYMDNTRDSWYGTHTVNYRFKDAAAADKLFSTLRQKFCTEDSIFWYKDSIGSQYVCNRGWDGDYVECPEGINKSAQVKVFINRQGFSIWYGLAPMIYMEDFATPDSLQQIIGVQLPDYHFVNCLCNCISIDAPTEMTVRLSTLPSKALICAIERNDKWTKRDDGTYRFELFSDEKQTYITAVLNPRSHYVTIEEGMY